MLCRGQMTIQKVYIRSDFDVFITKQTTMTDYRAKYFGEVRAKNYAWAQVYSRDDKIIELQRRELERPGNVVLIREIIVPHRNANRLEEPQQLPPHITRAMWEMAVELNRDYTCPVCLEFMTAETFSMSACGHEICTTCIETIKETTPLAMRAKCPTCRKNL